MLDIEGLQKSYGKLRVLEGVDLHAAPGEVCGLIGPNGAGKTTLVSIVTSPRDADSGSVRDNVVGDTPKCKYYSEYPVRSWEAEMEVKVNDDNLEKMLFAGSAGIASKKRQPRRTSSDSAERHR
ncbi:MAG: ATP-binding cassette domain-containing protein [Spirochaetia bacterium]